MTIKSLITVLLLVLLTTGCATVPQINSHQKKPVSFTSLEKDNVSEKGWWYARFRLRWPKDVEAAWYLGPLIANEIVAPALHQYANKIELWRFHRRAGRDAAGHQFSFIFYSSPTTAGEIYYALETNPLLKALIKKGKIKNVGFDNLDKITKSAIEDTSDKHWPEEIQKSWPYFIMGASQMWLNLTQQLANQQQKQEKSMDLEKRYQRIHSQLLALWKHEGNHALLHHLNALYGYEPLIITERKLHNF
ncbi:MAG: hypothetical protein V3V31_02480 [Methylococcales bacterium]